MSGTIDETAGVEIEDHCSGEVRILDDGGWRVDITFKGKLAVLCAGVDCMGSHLDLGSNSPL